MPDLTTVSVTREGSVVWVTLDRPEAANSRNQAMRQELAAVYAELARDAAARVIVLTGAGDRFFCAGMDLKEAAAPETTLQRRRRLRTVRDIELLAALPLPTIAAINGYAVGGGCEMALACDLRIMAAEARIGLPEVVHGLMPGGGATQRLPRLIGLARATELILTGDLLDGASAATIGLVNRAVPATDLRAEVASLAARLAERPAAALRSAKEALRAGTELPLSAGLDRELDGLLFLLADRADAPATTEGDDP